MNYALPLILLIASIAVIVGAVMYAGKYEYRDINNREDCIEKGQNCDGKNCCTIWKNGTCRKGSLKENGTECESKGHIGPLLVMLLGILLFGGFVVTLVMNIVSNHKKQSPTMGFRFY